MDKTRERVFGAVVIVSLCVIFGPMLFEATKQHRIQMAQSVPEQPSMPQLAQSQLSKDELDLPQPYRSHGDTLSYQAPLDSTSEEIKIEPLPKKEIKKSSEKKHEVDKPKMPTVAQVPDLKPVPKPKVKPKPEPAQVEEHKATVDNLENTPKIAMIQSGWSVQLATFSQAQNAKALLSKLKQAGYPAYIREKYVNGKKLNIVLVGPHLNKSDAEKLRSKLQEQYHLRGIVSKYQPT